jgi:hypothetical protein
MPSSAETALDAVAEAIIALERSCLDAESALAERRPHDVGAAFAEQTRLTAELTRLFAASPETSPAGDAKVAKRIDGVLAFREGQLERLRAYQTTIVGRLESIAKVRAFSRSIGKYDRSGGLYDTQQ